MRITHKIDLDRYYPNEIIDLHQQGVITLDEIVLSGRIYSTFGPELRQYVAKCLKLQKELADVHMASTVITERPTI